MQNFITTTPKGTEGLNISYSDEKRCANQLLKVLPPKWKVSFSWIQILFSDVSYKIDKKNKIVRIVYNQNLTHWWKELVEEIKSKI